jgi:hypothetical protein
MRQISSGKAATNEQEYPCIVAIAIAGKGLDIGLSRRIIVFHKTRHIELRHGRSTIPRGEGKSIIVGAFPIWKRPNPSPKSLTERYKNNCTRGGGATDRGEHCEIAGAPEP